MKSLFLPLIIVLTIFGCKSEKKAVNKASIKWLTISEVQEKMKTSPKKVLIDIYADWCGPCKRMAKYTFTDSDVVSYVNENYYAVKFNAESKEDLRFLDKTYKNKARTHEFAIQVGSTARGLSYPTIVYFDEDFKKLQSVPGYYLAEEYLKVAKYFGGNYYKTMSYESFQEEK